MIPAIVGVIVGLVSFFLMPETPAFLKRRIAYLQMTDEERAAQNTGKSDDSNGGVVQALKFIFSHRQMRSVALCAFIFMASTGVTTYYESIMKTGGMTTEQITTAMYFIPFVNAVMTAISGFLTDALGRKRSATVLSGIAFLGLTSFILCSSFGMAPALVGISYGFFIGGLWSACDILFIMIPGESSPTHLRVSVVGTMSIMSGAGSVISIALMTVGMLFVESIGLLCLCACVPFLLISIIILATKVKETKGVDLTTVTGSEWD